MDNTLTHVYDDYGSNYVRIANFQVKFRDVFNMQNTYEVMHDWIMENGWSEEDDADFPETFYLKREDQLRGTESWIHWRFQKHPEGTNTWRADMYVQFHILGMKETEILVDGQKTKTNSGEVEIKIWMYLIPEFKSWRENFILKHFVDVLWKRFLYKDKERWRKQFYSEAYRFQEMIKALIKMPVYLPEKEFLQEFYPPSKE